jgi:hypothetical protein
MQGEVTQKNLHLFIPGKIAGVAQLIARDEGCSPLEGLHRFYATKACKMLEREESKFWHFSPSQLYLQMKDME